MWNKWFPGFIVAPVNVAVEKVHVLCMVWAWIKTLLKGKEDTDKKTVTLEDEVKLNSVYTRMLLLVFNSITLYQNFFAKYIFENFVL